MPHPCRVCGGECRCDTELTKGKTPTNCRSCGCLWEDPEEDYNEPEYYQCLSCGWTGNYDPKHCPRCTGYCIDGVY